MAVCSVLTRVSVGGLWLMEDVMASMVQVVVSDLRVLYGRWVFNVVYVDHRVRLRRVEYV